MFLSIETSLNVFEFRVKIPARGPFKLPPSALQLAQGRTLC
jgi:hypothetical protein